jgi:hypothetical protein
MTKPILLTFLEQVVFNSPRGDNQKKQQPKKTWPVISHHECCCSVISWPTH